MERWLPIAFSSLHEISDMGRVCSYAKDPAGVILRGSRTKGYVRVYIAGKYYSVHHLVLDHFDRPRLPGEECLHDNDVHDDNRLSNLSWGTQSQNMHDRVRNGIHHQANKTECKNHHPLSGDNVIVTQRQRVCRECTRLARQRYNQKMRDLGVTPGRPGARLPS